MHGHFCLHDLIVFFIMLYEGFTCCVTCGWAMWGSAIKRFKNAARHKHYGAGLEEICPTCKGEEIRASARDPFPALDVE